MGKVWLLPGPCLATNVYEGARIAEEVLGGLQCQGLRSADLHRLGVHATPLVVAAGCNQAEVEGVIGGMPKSLESGVAVGVDCKFYDIGDAVGCRNVGSV